MEEVLRQKIAEPSGSESPATEQRESDYQFEIELHTGAKIYTDNAHIDDDTVSYSSKSGLIISLHRDEIKTMKKISTN